MSLLLLQIDGLARPILEANLDKMPHLRSLLGGSHRIHSLFSGLPSTTPSFQGEFFYGVRQCVPAWVFREHSSGQVTQLLDAATARRRQSELERQGAGLLKGGTAYACLMSGGAETVHFGAGQTLARHALQASRMWTRLPRLLQRLGAESARGLRQALRWPRGSLQRQDELAFVGRRALLQGLLTPYLAAGIQSDLRRGVPVIYANFLAYDSLAHLRGPGSPYACQVLPELDALLESMLETVADTGSQVWIFSDHGQDETEPYTLLGSGMLASQLGRHVVSADCGPLAHLYVDGELARRAAFLVEERGVPQVMYRTRSGVRVRNRRGEFALPRQWPEILGERHPFGPEAASDLVRLAHHAEAGALVALGYDWQRRLSFVREAGGHGGPSPLETHAFAIVPEQARLGAGTARGINGPVLRPLDLRQTALQWLDPRFGQSARLSSDKRSSGRGVRVFESL